MTSDPPNSFWDRAQAFFAPRVMNPRFWLIFLAILVIGPIGRTLAREAPKPPAMKLALPDFELVNDRGERFGSAELRGRVYVADFVFTSCPTVCPKLTQRMSKIQHRSRNLGSAFQLVTFTVDPENDTPERLSVYARSVHANPARWNFLTGPLGEVEKTVVKGFKLAMGKEEVGEGIFSIFHGERFVLVDQNGNIRGYYEATDEGVNALLRDAGLLANLGG
jgi:protein SCO1/2